MRKALKSSSSFIGFDIMVIRKCENSFIWRGENDHFRIIYNLMAVHTCPIVKKEKKSFFSNFDDNIEIRRNTRVVYISRLYSLQLFEQLPPFPLFHSKGSCIRRLR